MENVLKKKKKRIKNIYSISFYPWVYIFSPWRKPHRRTVTQHKRHIYKIDNWVNGAVRSFHLVKHKRDGFSHLMLVGTENELRRAAYTTIFGFNISSSTHVQTRLRISHCNCFESSPNYSHPNVSLNCNSTNKKNIFVLLTKSYCRFMCDVAILRSNSKSIFEMLLANILHFKRRIYSIFMHIK